MERIPEPELMNEAEQARAYANADFEEPHNHFIELLKESVGEGLSVTGTAMDLGCGAADISIRFSRVYPKYMIDALDGSEAMLAEGRKAIRSSTLDHKINLIHSLLDNSALQNESYNIIFSNSLLHHLHDPMVLWNSIAHALGKPKVFIMDLMRPESEERLQWMVKEYSANEPDVLQRDFANSLRAAFTLEEINQQLIDADLDNMKIEVVSDRHFIIYRK